MNTSQSSRDGFRRKPFKVAAVYAVMAAIVLQPMQPAFGQMAQVPPLYTPPPDVNVVLTLDDSGSMRGEGIPEFGENNWSDPSIPHDDVGTFTVDKDKMRLSFIQTGSFNSVSNRLRRWGDVRGNALYYNPATTYKPWPKVGSDTTQTYANADPEKACWTDGFNYTVGFTSCLAARQYNLKARVNVTGSGADADNPAKNYWPATYFIYTGPATYNDAATNFNKIEIKPSVTSYAKAPTRTDCTGATCTYGQELQNFANWFQYYRTRALMAKGAVGTAFSRQAGNLRVGYGALNGDGAPDVSIDGVINKTMVLGVRQFTVGSTARQAFFQKLYETPRKFATPLRRAADDVGQYFSRKDSKGPWGKDPGTGTEAPTSHLACRRNFHILTTDGYWTGDAATVATGSYDTLSGSTPDKPDGTTFTYATGAPTTANPFRIHPFADTHSGKLSDVAAYYWRYDLRDDLPNKVVPSKRDPAFWQHVTTYTVGIGIEGSSTTNAWATQAGRDALIANGTAVSWPSASSNSASGGDDLVHASMSGRGRYFLAINPNQFADELAAALREVTDQPVDTAAVSSNSEKVSIGSRLYQGTFSPSNWYGRLYSFKQNVATGATNTDSDTAEWEASTKMPAPTARNIYSFDTSNAGQGTEFNRLSSGGLTATQLSALGVDAAAQDDMIAYLRGSDAKEQSKGGSFRNRTRTLTAGIPGGVLGDIAGSAPTKGPTFGAGYERLATSAPGQSAYLTYRFAGNTALTDMVNTLFVGANDGIFHAFNATTGVERFGFVSNAVYSVPRTNGFTAVNKLKELASFDYNHYFTKDGTPQLGDVYNGSQWRTMLAASHGAGARSVFGIDVTKPDPANGFSKSSVKWEFGETGGTDTTRYSADMGYVLGYPQIGRMRDGTWVAIFGNGYDSVNGKAVLFIVDINTGALHKKFEVDTAGSNGLSQPNILLNSNREITRIFAGDLKGNLWAFDVDNTDNTKWKVAFSGSALFSAKTAGGVAQPITIMPELSDHPSGGVIVSFGTGKLFEKNDTSTDTALNTNLNTQTVYGIWDKPAVAPALEGTVVSGRSLLQAQTISSGSITNYDQMSSTAVDWTSKRGWMFDLGTGGERVHVSMLQLLDALYIVANKPETDPCSLGGTSRVFVVSPTSGGRRATTASWDTNGNGVIDAGDSLAHNVYKNTGGILTRPTAQLQATSSYSITNDIASSVFAIFDRGQTGSQAGGVELGASQGRTPTSRPTGCADKSATCAISVNLTFGESSTKAPNLVTGGNISFTSTGSGRFTWRQIR
jgi:type IV pilus assembly protein PilY1